MDSSFTMTPAVPSALRDAQTLLAAVVESSNDAIISKTLEGVITSWNPAAERLFGWSEAEVRGRRNPIVPPEKSAEFLEHLEVLLDGGAFMQKTISRQRKDGQQILVTLSAAPLLDDDGRIEGVVAVFARAGAGAD